ncbi:MAG: HAMP domain-containing protein [Oligoflexus sp.]|nr:HAMP domain-containing protein [Pseudopedobacter sp.]
MTIRTKMTVLFSGIVTVLLIGFCIIIYFLSEIYRQTEYKTRLRQEALTAATILFNNEEVSPDLLKLLARNHMTVLDREEIVLFNTKNQIIYKSGLENKQINTTIINDIRINREKFWNQDNKEKFGMVFKNKNQEYIVIASAVDAYGLSKQQNLALLLACGSLMVILISAILGRFFARGLLIPMQQMIRRIDNINASELNLRLHQQNEKDELGQLSSRFNEMLDRLQKAFMLQRSFVSHASHELRTPLTAITGQIQVSLLANDNEHDLRLMAKSVLEDVNQLNKLTNNLLDLTSIDTEKNNIKFTLLNLLDVLLQVKTEIIKKYENINILISIEENEDYIPEIYANESLIYTAFINLMENGAKFSIDANIYIKMKISKEQVILKFQNKTKPVSDIELLHIFEPFMRGSNSKNTKGHGVGLPLTMRIVQLHNGALNATIIDDGIIEFTLSYNKVSSSG